MSSLKSFKDFLSRVKWGSVGGLVVILAVAALLLWLVFSTPFLPKYRGDGDLQVRSWVDPGKIGLAGESIVWVDVKNRGTKMVDVQVRIETYDKSLLFQENSTSVAASPSLGPGESRRLDFPVYLNATYGGKYGIKITASSIGSPSITDEVYIEAEKAD